MLSRNFAQEKKQPEPENERPLKELSDNELMQLWDMAEQINDMGQSTLNHITGYSDSLLNEEDIKFIRAGVLLQAKLCDKYGIPHPPVDLDIPVFEEGLSELEDDEGDWEYGDEPYEFMREGLHITMDAFASIDEIGDFHEEELFYDAAVLEPLLEEEEDAEKKIEDGFLDDELTYSGYHSLLSAIRECGADMVEVEELKVLTSRNMAKLVAAMRKGKVPKCVEDFWDEFSVKTWMRTYYWVPMDNMEEIKGDKWCSVYAILNHYEEGILVGDLYKHMSVRVGAYIAQEFAERYAA